MKIRTLLSLLAISWLCVAVAFGAKKSDPYKVLGVDKKASQRDIQKAFHKLSLQYHPDKNKSKGAQEKFAEINNAYEILSDEEKRKNYDLYGDEKGNPGFDPGQTGGAGGRGGYTHFTSGPGAGGWQTMGGPGGSFSSFSFSSSGSNPFDSFDIGDIFGAFSGGGQFGGFKSGGQSGGGFKKSSAGAQSGPRTTTKSSIQSVSHQLYKKEILGGGMTWLLLFKASGLKDNQYYESLMEEVGNSLQGVPKVGVVDCDNEPSMCKSVGAHPRRSPRLFIYTCNMVSNGDFLVEYNGDLAKKDLKVFCQEHLPRYSKPVDLKGHNLSPNSWSQNGLPSVLLLSTKKETPLIWRALSGQYRNRINFFNAQVDDVSEPVVKQLGVNSLPSIVGWLENGGKHVLKAGITVKDMQSTMNELSSLLDGFEKKNKKGASSQAKKSETNSSASKEKIPSLTGSNFDFVCGENIPVCIIGAYRSAKERRKLESILSTVSQKPLSRQQQSSMSYSLVDATKYPDFLKAFDKSGYRSSDKVLLAYKPRKGKFAVHAEDSTDEEGAERFIGSVLSGDAHFSKTRQKPKLT